MSDTPPLMYETTPSPEAVHPLARLVAYIARNPEKRKLVLHGQEVWLDSEYGSSCVNAPVFNGEIIAPTYDGGEPLF